MEVPASKMYEKYKEGALKFLKEQGQIAVLKSTPTVTEHPEILPYMEKVGMRISVAQKRQLERVKQNPGAQGNATPEEANFIAVLCKMAGYEKILEVGTFLGYTTLVLAESLPECQIITLDIGEELIEVAKIGWREAGVENKIETIIRDARFSMAGLLEKHGPNSFDMIFIDADKSGYDTYYELGLQLVRPGGALLVDNVLWSGKPVNMDNTELATVCIRNLNEKIARDERVLISLVPFSDGVTICLKK